MRISDWIKAFKEDFRLSFQSEENLHLENCERISSLLTAFHRFFTGPAILTGLLYCGISLLFPGSIENIWCRLGLICIIFILGFFIGWKFLTAKHVFIDNDNQFILIFFPYRNKIITVDKYIIRDISSTIFIRPDFITIKIRENINGKKVIKSFHFLAPFRLFKLYREHPVVEEIHNKIKPNYSDVKTYNRDHFFKDFLLGKFFLLVTKIKIDIER